MGCVLGYADLMADEARTCNAAARTWLTARTRLTAKWRVGVRRVCCRAICGVGKCTRLLEMGHCGVGMRLGV
jgi:hypothetical protein